MNNEWLDLAYYINFDKVIMHGQISKKEQHDDFYLYGPVQIEQVLTREQQREVEDLRFKHEREMLELLKSFVND